MHTTRSTSGSHYVVPNLSHTNLTTKHPRMLKCLSPQSKLTSITLPCKNSAKRAIRTWKKHLLAGIAGLPKSFLIGTNWCCFTTQCNATLNMLCPCCQNPFILAHEVLEGLFSFDATPMAPLGTEVFVHMKPNQQCTWGYHASKVWDLSHAANHYRCI